jgi:hypothetical protein
VLFAHRYPTFARSGDFKAIEAPSQRADETLDVIRLWAKVTRLRLRQNERVVRRNVAQIPGALPSEKNETFGLLFETGGVGRIDSILRQPLQEHAVEQLTNSESEGPGVPPPTPGHFFRQNWDRRSPRLRSHDCRTANTPDVPYQSLLKVLPAQRIGPRNAALSHRLARSRHEFWRDRRTSSGTT